MQNLQLISTKELRDNLSEVLERVAIGRQNFLVSKFGKKKALIVPVVADLSSKKIDFKQLSAFGVWKKRADIKNSNAWTTKLRAKQSQRKSL